jgi:hypothetical protein
MKLLLSLFLFFTLASSLTCGGNCPSNTCPSCICGTRGSTPNATYWCSKYNWSMSCCLCIIDKESAGNKNAMNYNVDSSFDAGLFQINSFNWNYCGITENNVCNMNKNLECAIQVYKWGSNTWKFWTTAPACGCSNSP